MSLLTEKINNHIDISQEFLAKGFEQASLAGGFLVEVKSMVGEEKFPEWVKENCNCNITRAEKYIALFNGKEVQLKAKVERGGIEQL